MEWCNLRSGDSVGGGAAAVVGRPPARQQLSSTRICSFGVFCVFCLSRGFLYFVFAAAARQQLNNRDFVLRRLVHFVFFCGYQDYLDLCLDFLYFCSSVFGWQFCLSIFVFCVFEHISPSAPAVVNGHRGRKYLHTLISIIGLVKTIAFHAWVEFHLKSAKKFPVTLDCWLTACRSNQLIKSTRSNLWRWKMPQKKDKTVFKKREKELFLVFFVKNCCITTAAAFLVADICSVQCCRKGKMYK